MFKYLKDVFHKKKTNNDIIEKIEILKTTKIEPYISLYTIDIFHRDIIDYINDLNFILEADLETSYPRFRQITPASVVTVDVGKFFTNENFLLEDVDAIFNMWLDLLIRFIRLYEIGIASLGKGYLYSNSNKLRPYIINIEHIVNTIYKNTIES
jgi:hypothetical protein